MLTVGLARAEDDFGYWSRYSIKALDTKYVDYSTYFEFRMKEDAGNGGLWLISQKLNFPVHPNLSLGFNYTYLENKTTASSTKHEEFSWQHRLELEANPKISLWKDRLILLNRNRVEFRWIEGKGSDHGRFRQRLRVFYKIKKWGWLKGIYADNEMLLDFNRREVNEWRTTPFAVSFKIHEKISLDMFYMIQSKKGRRDWNAGQIAGTYLSVSF